MTRHVGADVLVTTPTDDAVHELSGGASAVWEELRTPRTVVDLVDRLATAHGAEPDDIAAEVEGCLETLVRLKVVAEVQDFDG
jgi:hypothetical protein